MNRAKLSWLQPTVASQFLPSHLRVTGIQGPERPREATCPGLTAGDGGPGFRCELSGPLGDPCAALSRAEVGDRHSGGRAVPLGDKGGDVIGCILEVCPGS